MQLHILHITPTYVPAWERGGPIVSVHNLNKALVAAGVSVTVYTTDIGLRDDFSAPRGTPVDVDGVRVYYFKRSFPQIWEYSRDLFNVLKRTASNFDVIHITSVFLAASTLGARYAKQAEVPYIISPRGTLMRGALVQGKIFFKKIYLAFVERRNLAHAVAIHFTVSQEEVEYRQQGLPVTKSLVIPNIVEGVDVVSLMTRRGVFRKNIIVPDKAQIVLFLGRLDPKKGFDTLFLAFSEVVKEEPRAILAIVGTGDRMYLQALKREAVRLGIDGHIRFVGHLNGEEKHAAYIDSDVFVLPSYSENFGMAVAEALVCGTPVVITESVGIAEDVRAANAGLVVPKTVSAVRDGILSVLHNITASREMASRGQKLVAEKYAPQIVAGQCIRAYTEIITAN